MIVLHRLNDSSQKMPSKHLRCSGKAVTSFDWDDSRDRSGFSKILTNIDAHHNEDVQGMDEDDEEPKESAEDEKAFSDDTHVSESPLHLMYSSTRNISQERLDRLIKSGFKIKRGKWSEKEINRLSKNWNWICKHHPSFGDAAAAFGIWNKTNEHNRTETRRRYAKFNLMRRMAYRLDERLICDVYEKCKKLIGFRKFKHRSAADLSDDIRDKILEDIKCSYKSVSDIGSGYDVSPVVVDHIKRFSKSNGRHKWSAEEDVYLESAIERQFNNVSDVYSLTKRQIDWTRVRRDLMKCGMNMTEPQIYGRWYRNLRNNNGAAE